MNNTLNPCPFCGGKFPIMAFDENSVDVTCPQCSATMPNCNDEADAIGRWNERTSVASSEISSNDATPDKMRLEHALGNLAQIKAEAESAVRALIDIPKREIGSVRVTCNEGHRFTSPTHHMVKTEGHQCPECGLMVFDPTRIEGGSA